KPGLSVSELDNGFNPEPPDLIENIKEGKWSAEQLFWITKHGIKMSAMPAFGHNHSDEEIWTIVAFLERLPKISPEEYKAMEKAAEGKPRKHNH
ncbi:MAG: c-type cytochrome, partial [Thermodesulfobacteriota bacterium]